MAIPKDPLASARLRRHDEKEGAYHTKETEEKKNEEDLNKRYSASGKGLLGMLPAPRGDGESVGFPVLDIRDMEEAGDALAQIENEQLRERAATFLTILLQGGKHRTAMEVCDFVWSNWVNVRSKYPALQNLWLQCRDLGEDFRRILRMDAAHERAVDGVDDPIYSPSGKFLGSRKLYSDRLLELLLKADDPDRFREKKQVEITGNSLSITTFDRDALKQEILDETKEADVEEIEES
eukprot:GHVR01071384.1.p1 GENE.GHVR01071384.1~~GHVR01071384.1.p1  ORF type:complete len:237 (+),score=35.76 GHVR01071384.1:954-1664(+)